MGANQRASIGKPPNVDDGDDAMLHTAKKGVLSLLWRLTYKNDMRVNPPCECDASDHASMLPQQQGLATHPLCIPSLASSIPSWTN